jgi:enoyl-CoA hydratase
MSAYRKTERQDDGVLVATMNRPQNRNALGHGDDLELIELAHVINEDLSVKAQVYTGAGTVFCAGVNLPELQARTASKATAVSATVTAS